MQSWIRIPKMPNTERNSPIVGDGRPSPPLNFMADVKGTFEGGVERKTGKTCMNAELCRGSRPKEMMVKRTSRVQMAGSAMESFGRGGARVLNSSRRACEASGNGGRTYIRSPSRSF